MRKSVYCDRVVCLVVVLVAAWLTQPFGAQTAGAQPAAAPAAPRAAPADVAAAKQRLGEAAIYRFNNAGALTHITIPDGADITADDVILFNRLADLHTLHIFDCRSFNDEMIGHLTGLERLRSLAITNSGLTDAGVETLVKAFPDLVELDLSSNTNLTGTSLKLITGLEKLETLTLLQNRFNDLNTRRLSKMPQLRTLDLRGNMEAGDMTLEVIGKLPNLTALKHRSTAVTDAGLQGLAESKTLESLLIQDFVITNESGPQLAKLSKLSSLEVFRCQGFGSDGVLALADMPLTRLTLRDLPDVGDAGLAVLAKLPNLKRLYLHELASVGDEGLRQLGAAKQLEVLDIWSLPKMTDATIDIIAALPNLKELSIRETGVSEAAAGTIAAMPKLQSLTFKNNGPLSPENAAKLTGRKWTKLDLGGAAAAQ